MKNKPTFEVRDHPHSKEHVLLVVNTFGRVYACSVAWDERCDVPRPNEAQVRYVWTRDRHAFLPYNESEGCYVVST